MFQSLSFSFGIYLTIFMLNPDKPCFEKVRSQLIKIRSELIKIHSDFQSSFLLKKSSMQQSQTANQPMAPRERDT